MSLNFLVTPCREPARLDLEFGLCDDQNSTKAYTKTDAPKSWIATVRNENKIPVVFTAIDKCIIHDHEYPGRGRCDGMLTFSNCIYFVELKNMKERWLEDAKEQLESTIIFFKDARCFDNYRHKKAFACNRRHRHFLEINNEENLRFFRQHGFRLDVQSQIIVI